MRYDWHPDKAERNRRKHGVDFLEAATVDYDPYALVDPDVEHSGTEERERTLGMSNRSRVLLVVTTDRVSGDEDVRWIISARPANPKEAKRYADHLRRSIRGGRA